MTVYPVTEDADTSGYQMKIWGDVDGSENEGIKPNEADSAWMTYAANASVKLSAGDGSKTLYMKLRDRVHNTTSQVSQAMVLNTAVPVVTLTGAPVSPNNEISTQTGKDSCTFRAIVALFRQRCCVHRISDPRCPRRQQQRPAGRAHRHYRRLGEYVRYGHIRGG